MTFTGVGEVMVSGVGDYLPGIALASGTLLVVIAGRVFQTSPLISKAAGAEVMGEF